MQPCVFCHTSVADPATSGPDRRRYICPRCGTFDVSGTVEELAKPKLASDPKLRAITSHVVRRMQRDADDPPFLTSASVERIWSESKLPSPVEQLEALLELIGDQQAYADAVVEFDHAYLAGMLGAGDDTAKHDYSGVNYVLKHAEACGFVQTMPVRHPMKLGMRLTFAGWAQHDQIKRRTVGSRRAFMAMKFGDALLDQVYRDCFKSAVARTGFELRRLDEKQPAGLIDNQMRVAIRTARFLVADLTHGNQGAYWEAGFAEGLDKPVIYTCEKTQFDQVKTHFDTNHHVTIRWDATNLAAASDDLAATIRNTLPAEAKLTDD